jgi:hypothetical protein
MITYNGMRGNHPFSMSGGFGFSFSFFLSFESDWLPEELPEEKTDTYLLSTDSSLSI